MNSHPTNPRFKFRLFGQDFGYAVAALSASPPVATREEVLHTYILSATNQRYNIKICDDKLDVKVLLHEYQGLARWHPYLQFAFPLTSAFLHEFLFAWLEIDPPLLRRCHYTARQFLEELIIPNPHLRAAQVAKQCRHYTMNHCQVEIGSLWVNDRHAIQTVAVEAAAADAVLETIALLGLQGADNTNYIVGLSQLLEKEAPLPWLPTLHAQSFMPLMTRQLVFDR